jgi:hypothetical protein
VLVFLIEKILFLRGKKTKFPHDPHRIYAKSFDVARVFSRPIKLKYDHDYDSAPRMDILPSHLQAFKEVIYNPPALFNDPINAEVGIYTNARICGKNPIALTSSGELIQESLFLSNKRNKPAISYLSPFELKVFLGVRKSTKFLPGKYCLLTSFWDNFGHWIPEHLLKVKNLIDSDVDLSELKFLLRNPISEFQYQLLKVAGIKSHQIFTWDYNLAIVEELVVPTYPQITTKSLNWIDELIPKDTSFIDKYGAYIYLSRQNQNHRKLTNHHEVQKVLNSYGFKTIIPEDLTFLEQVHMARNAKILFGPQGSAMTLQIFMPAGTIIETFPQNRIHLFNRQVAMLKGHRHFILIDPRGPNSAFNAESNMQVNIKELEDILIHLMRT